MAAPEDADKAEVVQRNATGELRSAPRFVGAVAVVHWSAWTSHRRENLPNEIKYKRHKSVRVLNFYFFNLQLLSTFIFFFPSFLGHLDSRRTIVKKQQQKQQNTNPLTPIWHL
jgi:hypothetical protein